MLFGANTSGEIRAYGSATAVGAGPTPTTRPLASPSRRTDRPEPVRDHRPIRRDHARARSPARSGHRAERRRLRDRNEQPRQPDRTGRHGRPSLGQERIEGRRVRLRSGPMSRTEPTPRSRLGRMARSMSRTAQTTASRSSPLTGDFVRQFGSFGNGDGQFVQPFDLSADAEGNVYVLDDDLLRLTKFGPNGAFLWTVDGTTDEELDGGLHAADIDSQGRIVVGNDGTRRVMYLDPDGKVVDAFTAAECDVSVDPDGNVYCNSFVADEILVYSPSHELIGSWSGPDMILGRPHHVRSQRRDPRPRSGWRHRQAQDQLAARLRRGGDHPGASSAAQLIREHRLASALTAPLPYRRDGATGPPTWARRSSARDRCSGLLQPSPADRAARDYARIVDRSVAGARALGIGWNCPGPFLAGTHRGRPSLRRHRPSGLARASCLGALRRPAPARALRRNGLDR